MFLASGHLTFPDIHAIVFFMASSSKKAIYAALVGNTLIAISKFIAAIFTGSSAMLSEGIHSTVDTGNQILLLYGLKRANRPANEIHPFGHGKEVYFWSFVVAILIFAVGSGVSLYEGIRHLQHPKQIDSFMLSYIVLSLAFVFEAAAWLFALREFSKVKGRRSYLEAVKRGKDPSIFVVLFEDSAAMLGIIVAVLGVMLTQLTGNTSYDSIASIIIGLILGGTAIWLAYETKGLLIGERANIEVVQGIREIVNQQEGIIKANEILTMHVGPEFILVNLSIEFADEISVVELEQIIAGLDNNIKQSFPHVKKVFIEAESLQAITKQE